MKKAKINTSFILGILLVIMLIWNLSLNWQIRDGVRGIKGCSKQVKSLPCESVPVSWAVTNYECANSLLLAMNVTNVKFNPPGTANYLSYNKSVFTSES